MTPETYMRRFHGDTEEDVCPLRAEELYWDAGTGASPAQTGGSCPAVQNDDGGDCCCKSSMARALRLLGSGRLNNLVDFDAFFFLTDALAIGSPIGLPGDDTDNISDPSAVLHRISPCCCDLLEVSGTAYFPIPTGSPVALEDVERLSLCAVKAAAFQIAEATCERECGDSNYDRAIRAIRRLLRDEDSPTGGCGCDNCCCAQGVLGELATRNLSGLATLTVGPLVLQNVSVLGSVGTVLVLSDEELSRVYLVCANAVETLG